jgi:hypothetical protein
MPVTRLFLEPQNTIAISSAREKPKRRAANVVAARIVATSAASTSATTSRPAGGRRDHKPESVAALNTP